MKSLSIKGTKRVGLSGQELSKLRADGNVPCVLYGSGKENVHFFAPAKTFKNLVYTPNVYTVDLDVDGENYKAVMREIQFHPVKDNIMHIDFEMIFDNKPVVIDVPVKLSGSPEGVKEGGRLVQKLRKMKLKGLATLLPDSIELNVTPLKIGNSIRVGEMKMDGITFLDSPNNIIVGVRVTREVVEEVPVAAATTAAAPAAGAAAPGAAPAAAGAAAAPAAAPAKGGDKKPAK